MNEPILVGLTPWLPWPLRAMRSWIDPVAVERFAALRIGVATVLLLDILWIYWPNVGDFLGSGSIADPAVTGNAPGGPWWLGAVESPWIWHLLMGCWALSAAFLLVGQWSNVSALAALFIGQSVRNGNIFLHNAGDNIRHILLFYLILSPCGAIWTWHGRRRQARTVVMAPWPLQLLAVQMNVMYLFNGLAKFRTGEWRSGEYLGIVMKNVAWTRWSFAVTLMPEVVCRLLTWSTLGWEILFPVFFVMPRIRPIALWIGVFFHLGTFASLRLGLFPLYSLCFYLPFVPWERYLRPRLSPATNTG